MNRTTFLARAVFGLLLLATCTAFFVAQRLKQTDPLVYSVNVKRYVSPNGDGQRDRARLRFRVKRRDAVTVEIFDRSQHVVRVLARDRAVGPGPRKFQWNGRDAAGRPLPDGAYRIRITLRDAGRTFVPDKFFVVDRTAPELTATVGDAADQSASRRRPVRITYSGTSPRRRAEVHVHRVLAGERVAARPSAVFLSDRGETAATWDGTIGHFRRRCDARLPGCDLRGRSTTCFGRVRSEGRQRPAPPGDYVLVVRACDAAANVGTNFRDDPPAPGGARGRAGVRIAPLSVAPAMQPLLGAPQRVAVGSPPPGRYRWQLRPAGGGAPVARGTATGGSVTLTRPRRARAGLHQLVVAAGDSGRARAPVVVGGRNRARLLVVHPAIAWQATARIDIDGDGFGDHLDRSDLLRGVRPGPRRLAATRPLASGELPAGLGGAIAIERAVRAAGVRHEATTDYALALDPRRLRGRDALLFSGDERWITPQLGVALRKFVERGGRVMFFGPDAFRRTVRVGRGSISQPSQRADRDVFGESVETVREAPAPVVAFSDPLAVFGAPTGLFRSFETSRSRARGTRLVLAAGRSAERPAIVGYRLGRGLVIRVGAGGWQAAALRDPAVAAATRRLIGALAR